MPTFPVRYLMMKGNRQNPDMFHLALYPSGDYIKYFTVHSAALSHSVKMEDALSPAGHAETARQIRRRPDG